MAFLRDDAYNALLNDVADNADQLDLCTSEPGSYGAIAGATVCTIAMTVGSGNGDYLLDDGAVSGRELNLLQQTGTGSGTGAANYAAFSDGSAVLYGTCAASGDTVNSGSGVTVNAGIPFTVDDVT